MREPKYAFHDDDCTKITDAEGNIPQTRWVAHIRKYVQKLKFTFFFSKYLFLIFLNRDTKNGGPVHWIHENYQCPNCNKDSENSCCQNTQGGFCRADSVSIKNDQDVKFLTLHTLFFIPLAFLLFICYPISFQLKGQL